MTDFNSSQGDRIHIDTVAGNEDTLEALGLAVADNSAHANITNTDGTIVYLTINDIDHMLINNTNFTSYFEVV